MLAPLAVRVSTKNRAFSEQQKARTGLFCIVHKKERRLADPGQADVIFGAALLQLMNAWFLQLAQSVPGWSGWA